MVARVRPPPLAERGALRAPAGGEDRQQPHERDELYHVLAGRAVLIAGAERFEAGPGSVFYVKAGVPHGFVESEEDLEVLVFFGGARSGDAEREAATATGLQSAHDSRRHAHPGDRESDRDAAPR